MARRAQKWIQKAIKRPGSLTRKAKARGMTPLEFARKVKANPERYDTQTRRQANLALTLARLSRRKKKKK